VEGGGALVESATTTTTPHAVVLEEQSTAAPREFPALLATVAKRDGTSCSVQGKKQCTRSAAAATNKGRKIGRQS